MNEFEKEFAKNTAELSKEVVGDLVRPTSKSIGENLGLLVDGVIGWLGYFGQKQRIKREQYLAEYKEKISNKIGAIPQENLIEPPISIAGPIVEASKYYYEEIHYQEMFSQLLASACDKRYSLVIHPAFVEILKQLSPLDAKLLNMFKYHDTYPVCDIQGIDSNEKITPFNQSMFDFKDKQNEFSSDDYIYLTASLDNLTRLGIVTKNIGILELNYNYDGFKENFMYKSYLTIITNQKNIARMLKARIELTDLGRKLCNVIFMDKK